VILIFSDLHFSLTVYVEVEEHNVPTEIPTLLRFIKQIYQISNSEKPLALALGRCISILSQNSQGIQKRRKIVQLWGYLDQ